MSWDPITRIVGSLGIYATVDFANREVVQCHSTSSVFRGYSIFMKGKDPRDAHFITSRICGICGDNHATCSVYTQNMAYQVRPPHLGEWIINLGEAAEYMFDHNIFQENLVGVDYCEKMVAETNPGVLELANSTEAPHAREHGYRTIGDIMRSLNPFEGEFYREALQVSRSTREMFCLMEGRHVHPSTLYPGGIGTVGDLAGVHRLPDASDALRRVHEARRADARRPLRLLLRGAARLRAGGATSRAARMLGRVPGPGALRLPLRPHERLGPAHVRDARCRRRRAARHHRPGRHQPRHADPARLVVLRRLGRSGDVRDRDPLGNPVDRRHPWNQHTNPRPQKRDFNDKYSWTMSPRWFDGTDHLALDTGGGPSARLWSTALAGLVDIGYVKATGSSVVINLPRTMDKPETTFEWKIPQWSNAIERNRARTYFQAYAAACALHFVEQALSEVRAGRTQTWEPFRVPEEAISVGFTEAVRGVLSHHMVIREGKIANYHPYPPTPWNGSVRDMYGTPGPYEDAVQNTPIFEENPPERFKGIDIMRAVRSFDPCLPCGVHMYLGNGRELERVHTPAAFGGGF